LRTFFGGSAISPIGRGGIRVGVRPRCYHNDVLEARLRSDRLALAAALVLTLCGALAAVAFPPLTPILLAPAVVLAAAARPAGLLLAPLAAALPLPFALRIALLAAAGAAALAAALAASHRKGLEQRALVDPLTGLYRPEFFGEALEVELRRVHRYGGEVALVVLDLDDFKQVNDRHGHATGNEVLRRAGRLLRTAARDSDVAARFGGEELVLLVRGDERSATAAAARFVQGLREQRFGDGLRVTCSAGVAALAHGGDSASLFAAADEALYEAKRRGKDRVVVARGAQAQAQRMRRSA
jgi:diguanylate cyclase (GGDEF)-like protein